MQARELDMEGLPPPSAIKWNDRWMSLYIINLTDISTIDVIAHSFSIHASSELFLSFPVSPDYLCIVNHLSLHWETANTSYMWNMF